MGARTVLALIEKYMRLFEAGGLEDLGELPARVARGAKGKDVADEDDTDLDAVVDEIEDEVETPELRNLEGAFKEVVGEEWEVKMSDEDDGLFEFKHKDEDVVISLRVVVDDGEPVVVFRRGDEKVTVSLYPLLKRKYSSFADVASDLSKSKETVSDVVGQLKNFSGLVDVVNGEEDEEVEVEGVDKEEDEVEDEVEDEERKEESILLRGRRRGRHSMLSERLRRTHRVLNALRRLKERKEEEATSEKQAEEPYVVKNIADTEVKYTQVGQDKEEEGSIASRVMGRIKTADLEKKVSQADNATYPDIVGYIVNPEPK